MVTLLVHTDCRLDHKQQQIPSPFVLFSYGTNG